ncbi:Digeranylgeranylglycerophospholipid reductase [uncultured archaeon]|nr:Digeranylgeranylglycerophospholipid reductase [uncultured archaeon]
MRDKVAVIGAGTAGLIAAKTLCELGIGATVYDQKRRLGFPPMASGIVSIKGLEGLGIDYARAVTNTLYGADIHAGREVMHIMSKKPMARVLDREKLNIACYDECVSKGARIFTGRRLGPKDFEDLHKDNIIVGADGAVSAVARHFSMGAIRRHVLTYKAEFNVSPHDPRKVDLFFDNAVSPGLFGWMCPNGRDVLEVGVGIDSRHGNSRSAFDRLMRLGEVREAVGSAKAYGEYASIIPMRTIRHMVKENEEVLLVGDAAGQVKPTTGGGIVFGGNAAKMAARAIRDHVESEKRLGEYETAFMKRFGGDLAMHRAISVFCSRMGTDRLAALVKAGKFMGAEGFLSRYGDMDRPSLMLKRFFLRGLAD